jgi:hypothetical protein
MNPGTNATHVYQILVQLAKQTAQTSNQQQAIKETQQRVIYTQRLDPNTNMHVYLFTDS